MQLNKPLVSVLMTAYNREKYIAEAIESVLASTYTNFELIIVDDCSKDNTLTIAKKYEKIDSRIKVYLNECNLGDYPNRNKASSYANGEFIMFVDSDDKLLPETISRIFNDSFGIENFNFSMYLFDSNNKYLLNGSQAIRKHFFEKSFLNMGPGGTFIRKSFFESIGKYPEKYGPANDMFFNLKACMSSSILLLPYEFNFYRRHDGQEINNKFNYLYNSYLYLKDFLFQKDLPLSKSEIIFLNNKNRRRFLINIISYFLSTKNFRNTLIALKKTRFSLKDLYFALFH